MKLVKQLEGDLSRSSASIFGNLYVFLLHFSSILIPSPGTLPREKEREKRNFMSDTFEVVVTDDFDDVPLSSSTSSSPSDFESLAIMKSERNRFERQTQVFVAVVVGSGVFSLFCFSILSLYS